jgi:hypothetical protein
MWSLVEGDGRFEREGVPPVARKARIERVEDADGEGEDFNWKVGSAEDGVDELNRRFGERCGGGNKIREVDGWT